MSAKHCGGSAMSCGGISACPFFVFVADKTRMNSKYRKMLRLMEDKEKNAPRRARGEKWFLYILKCRDGKFYTGIAKDLERRFQMHSAGKASRFTRTRLPVTLVYRERCAGRTAALVRECAVKSLPRKKKEELISQA
jgi:putative endonuclease